MEIVLVQLANKAGEVRVVVCVGEYGRLESGQVLDDEVITVGPPADDVGEQLVLQYTRRRKLRESDRASEVLCSLVQLFDKVAGCRMAYSVVVARDFPRVSRPCLNLSPQLPVPSCQHLIVVLRRRQGSCARRGRGPRRRDPEDRLL